MPGLQLPPLTVTNHPPIIVEEFFPYERATDQYCDLVASMDVPDLTDSEHIQAIRDRVRASEIGVGVGADMRFVGAFAAKKLVSTAALDVVEGKSFRTGIVSDLVTLPVFRRKGIAARVMEKTEELAVGSNMAQLALAVNDEGLISYYERLGFLFREKDVMDDGSDIFMMSKLLIGIVDR